MFIPHRVLNAAASAALAAIVIRLAWWQIRVLRDRWGWMLVFYGGFLFVAASSWVSAAIAGQGVFEEWEVHWLAIALGKVSTVQWVARLGAVAGFASLFNKLRTRGVSAEIDAEQACLGVIERRIENLRSPDDDS